MKMGNFDIRVRAALGEPKAAAFVTITNPDGSQVAQDCPSMAAALRFGATYMETLAQEIERQLAVQAVMKRQPPGNQIVDELPGKGGPS